MTASSDEQPFEEAVALLARLVAVPSYSGQEHLVQQEIVSWFAEQALSAVLEPAADGLVNVVLTVSGASSGRTLLVGGHCDTVTPAAGYSSDPHKPYIRDGRLYGLGAMDMKAGLATAMIAVRDLAKDGAGWQGNLIFVALADEEAYSRGALGFVASGRRIDGAIMCEPHFARPAFGSIGKVNLQVTVRGKSAHASQPHLGISAVTIAARLIAAIDTLERPAHPTHGKASHCVLNVSSGAGAYEIRVPDFCEFLVNWHFMPGETAQEAVETIVALAKAQGIDGMVEVEIKTPRYDSFELAEDHEFASGFSKSFAAVTGAEPRSEFGFGVSDANIFNAVGIPTILFGPGGANMHAADEWADIGQIHVAHKIYVDFARRFLARDAD